MERMSVDIKEVSLDDIMVVHEAIPEFNVHFPYTIETFRERTAGKKMLRIIGYVGGKAAGYIVGYEKENDGSFYCWMAGVHPAHRRNGVLTALMEYQREWAKKNGYKVLKIKTRNNRREMLGFLVKQGFHFTDMEKYAKKEDHRILLEKELDFV